MFPEHLTDAQRLLCLPRLPVLVGYSSLTFTSYIICLSIQLVSLQKDHSARVDALIAQFAREHSQSETTRLRSKVATLEVKCCVFSTIYHTVYMMLYCELLWPLFLE